MDLAQKKSLMVEIPMFDKLSEEEREIVARHIDYMKISKGDVLIKEGSVGNTLYYLVKGTVEVVKESIEGHQKELSQVTKGSMLGEQALFSSDTRRSATVVALDDCELLFMTREKFDMVINDYPRIGVVILRGIGVVLSARLRTTSGRFADI